MRTDRTAWVDYASGRALVVETDGTNWMLVVERGTVRGPDPFPAGQHPGRWVNFTECASENPGSAPYDALKQRMLSELALGLAVRWFACTIEPRLERRSREDAARMLEASLADDALFQRMRAAVLAGPPSPDASTSDTPLTGRGAELLAAMVARFGHRPS